MTEKKNKTRTEKKKSAQKKKKARVASTNNAQNVVFDESNLELMKERGMIYSS